MKNLKLFLLLVLFAGGIISCKKSFENPNAANEEDALGSADGMIRLIVGMKHRFAVNSSFGTGAVFNGITTCGFITREIEKRNAANPDFVQFEAGGCNIASNNNTLTDLWANCLLVNKSATDILGNVYKVRDSGLKHSIQANALLYKAMSMGTLAMYWKDQPESPGPNAKFITRETALQNAISLLRQALPLSNSVPPAYAVVFDTLINLRNSVLALSARYNLMLGNYDSAFAKATQVDLTKRSAYYYNTTNQNPLYRSAFTNANGYLPKTNFGLTDSLLPDPNDKRIQFYIPPPNTSSNIGFGKNDNDLIPLYLPGEMLLIISEYYARKNDFTNSKIFLDRILTKTAAMDIFKVGAGLPAYNGAMEQKALLLEIYKNRCIELFMSGLKLDDSRRFGRPGPKDPKPERTLDYYPYPLSERVNNPNTPPDPGC